MRKIIVYQKQATKPIILTDSSNQTFEEITNQVLELFKSDKIFRLETENDVLCIRPSEVQSILITKSSNDAGSMDIKTNTKDATINE